MWTTVFGACSAFAFCMLKCSTPFSFPRSISPNIVIEYHKAYHGALECRVMKHQILPFPEMQKWRNLLQFMARPERLYWVLVLGLQYSCVLGFPNTCS